MVSRLSYLAHSEKVAEADPALMVPGLNPQGTNQRQVIECKWDSARAAAAGRQQWQERQGVPGARIQLPTHEEVTPPTQGQTQPSLQQGKATRREVVCK
jgi:hypothetical protein